MPDMTNTQRIRHLELLEQFDEYLESTMPDRQKRKFLTAEVLNTPGGKAHVFGTLEAPTFHDLEAQAWATKGGQNFRDVLNNSAANEDSNTNAEKAVKLARLAEMKPADRINKSREWGMTGLENGS